jgi:DNA-binding response OmpR family regulator
LEYQGKKEKLNNIWLQLLKFLWKKNGNLAGRDEIREELWGKDEKGKDDQITIIVGHLRKAFRGIGFKEETVKQQIIKTRSDTFTDHGRGGGGYRFLRGIVLLDFHN